MKKTLKYMVLLVLAFLLLPGSSFADPFNLRPYISLGDNGDEDTLQEIFDKIITSGSPIDAVNGQSSAALWTSSDGSQTAYLVRALRGDAGILGIYNSSSEMYVLDLNTQGMANFLIDQGQLSINGSLIDSTFGSTFGFYWQNTVSGLISKTEDSANQNGQALALAYFLPTGTGVTTQAGSSGSFIFMANGNDDWILAFEDVLLNSDFDFNDAVFVIEDMNPVPEPVSMLLFGVGLIGIGGYVRRRFK